MTVCNILIRCRNGFDVRTFSTLCTCTLGRGVNRCGHTTLMFKLNLWLKWVYEKRVEIVQLNPTSFGTNSLIFAHNLLLNSLVLKQIRSNLRLCLSNRSSSIYHCFKWTFVNDLYNYSFLFFSVQSVVEFSYYSYIHSFTSDLSEAQWGVKLLKSLKNIGCCMNNLLIRCKFTIVL